MKNKKAFSLIEVLLFVTVISMVFIVAIAVTTNAIRSLKIEEHRIVATRYAQELTDWLSNQKESDWYTFAGHSPPASGGVTWCVNDLDDFNWSSPGGPCSYSLAEFYQRTLTSSTNFNSTQVRTTVTVSWQELGNTYSVPITTVFNIFE